MTNIAELVEYVLLRHNDNVTTPRALKTFLDGLAELGVDKCVIKNKKILTDLIEKERGYRNREHTSEDESNVESSSDREEEEIASANGSEAEDTQESNNDNENDREETKSNSPETSTTFHSENPCEHCENSNVYGTLIMKCSKCSWHDSYKICAIIICYHQIPEERNNMKEGFLRYHDCGAITRKNERTLETTFYSRL